MKNLKSSQYTNLTKNKHEETGSNHNFPVYLSRGLSLRKAGLTALCMFYGQQNTQLLNARGMTSQCTG